MDERAVLGIQVPDAHAAFGSEELTMRDAHLRVAHDDLAMAAPADDAWGGTDSDRLAGWLPRLGGEHDERSSRALDELCALCGRFPRRPPATTRGPRPTEGRD